MNNYVKNLLTAIRGKNPFQKEIEDIKDKMGKADDDIRILVESFNKVQENAARCEQLLEKYKERLSESDKELMSYQKLTENLRNRIVEYQKRIEEYNKEIDRIQEKSKKKPQES